MYNKFGQFAKDWEAGINFERLRTAVRGLANEPRPHGVRKIKGAERSYRIRVGNYRVVYDVYDNENLVLLLQVARRTEATYRPSS